MKILIVNVLYPPLSFGGAEKSVGLLAEGMAARGHDVSIFTLHAGAPSDEVLNDVTVRRVPIDNVYWPYERIARRPAIAKVRWHLKDMWNAEAARRFDAFLAEQRPDIVHTNNIRGLSVALWAAARKAGIPVLHTLRDYSLMCVWGGMFKKGANCTGQCAECRFFSLTRKHMSSRIQQVVGNSRFTLDAHLAAGFFRGVESDVIFNIGGDSPSLPARSDPDGYLNFGYIGRIEPMKGVETVLRAATAIASDQWRLTIAGSGDEGYEADLKRRFAHPNIVWLGFVKPDEFYRRIDVCLVPSIWNEPLPRALLETFYQKKTAMFADSGGSAEAAALGRTAVGFPADDDRALKALMESAIADPDRWIHEGGFVSPEAERRISRDTVIDFYLDAYRRAIAAPVA